MASVTILLRVLLPSSEMILELTFSPFPFLSFLIYFCFSSCCRPHLMILVLAWSCDSEAQFPRLRPP